MKKLATSLGRILFVLLLLGGLSVCKMAAPSESPPPADALSFDQLVASLDELAGSATQSPSAPDRSVFSLPDGSLLSSADLSAYLNAIKKDLAAYVYSCAGGAPYLVVPKRVTFSVTYAKPNPRTVTESGLVWVPFSWNPFKRFPVISYQHGTQVYRSCAPSCFNANPLAVLVSPDLTGALQNYVECIVGGLMASAGYIVAMPDYAGFGISTETHPYVNLELGRSVAGIVDCAMAAFRDDGSVYLTGYSEGGYATMAGAIALQGKANLVKVVPYDLSGTMLTQMLYNAPPVKIPSYLLYTASGYRVEPDMIGLGLLLAHPWDEVALACFDGTKTNAQVNGVVGSTTPPEMLTDDAFSNYLASPGGRVYQLLAANDAWQGYAAPAPDYVHCLLDDVVLAANATEAVARTGGTISWVDPIPLVAQLMGSIHVGAYPTAMLKAFQLIRGR
jgi:hypothetical protein